MNDLLLKESYCKKKNINIKTYKVIPMTGSLGIIEWVVSIFFFTFFYIYIFYEQVP